MALITTEVAAEKLGITPRRILALIDSNQLKAQKIGSGRRGVWIVDAESLERRLFIQKAQRAWKILGISPRIWGLGGFSDPDEVDSFDCPDCTAVAYSPGGQTKYSGWAACPSCQWRRKDENVHQPETGQA